MLLSASYLIQIFKNEFDSLYLQQVLLIVGNVGAFYYTLYIFQTFLSPRTQPYGSM